MNVIKLPDLDPEFVKSLQHLVRTLDETQKIANAVSNAFTIKILPVLEIQKNLADAVKNVESLGEFLGLNISDETSDDNK